MIMIRPLTEADLEQHLQLCSALDQESEFMLLEPDERTTSVEQHRFINQPLMDAEHSTILVAEDEGRLVGHLVARGSELARIRHSVYLVIGILREYSNRGLGSRFFETLEHWRLANNITRLELTVMAHNEAALALYTKQGFDIEGVKRNSIRIRGQYMDEYYMARIFVE